MRSKDKMLFLNIGIIRKFCSERNYLTLGRGEKPAELKFDLDLSNKGKKVNFMFLHLIMVAFKTCYFNSVIS